MAAERAATGYVTDRQSPIATIQHKDFNPDGTLLGSTDELGIRTTYTYDTQGRTTSVWRDALHNGPRTDYTYDPSFPDKVATVTVMNPVTNLRDPAWQAWHYDYYQTGDPAPGALHHVYRVQTDGVTLDTVATYTYDAQGRITRQTTATGAETDYAYYPNGDLWTVTGPANNDLGTRPVTTYAYDTLGRVTAVTDPLGHVTTTTYDALGRVLTVTLPKPFPLSPLTFTTTYSYDNWDAATGLVFTTITDPNGRITRQGHDALGRPVKTVDPLTATTTYAYTRDLLTSITDANNNVTSYTYDTLKRLTRTTFPDGAYESYTYWNDGQLKTRTDRKNQTLTYAYDALKRLASKTYPGSTAVTYAYQGQALGSVLDTTTSPSETHTFTYDPSYRVATVTQATRGTLSTTYTDDDRPETVSVTGGPTTAYTYYPDGSLDTIAWSPIAGDFKYEYTLTGQYQTITFPNDQTRAFTYDDQGRLTQLVNQHPVTGTLASFTYDYDYDYYTSNPTLLGQRTRLTTTIPSQSLTAAVSRYLYDAGYQLTQAGYPAPAPYNGEVDAWTYDAIGNRTTKTVNGTPTAYTYFKNGSNPLNGQRLQSDGTNAYTYDANGNTATRTGVTFGWSPDDRMTSIAGGVTASYTYDYQGRRTSKTTGGTTTSYVYEGLNLIHTGGASQADYLFGPGIDEPLAMLRNVTISYYSVDGLGSVALLSDPTGTVQDAYLYDAWGEVKGQSGTLANDFGYTAREFGEAGMWYYRARYYQPGIGRFGSEDRFSSPRAPDGVYRYASASPVLLRDPLGLFSMGWGCDGCPDVSKPLGDATQKWCDENLGMITDPDLRACIDKSCKKGKIICKSCPPGQLGGPVDTVWAGITTGFGAAGSRTAPICTSNWEDVKAAGAGAVVIHEWAHGCGWQHGQGKGVPGNDGTF